MQTQSLNTCGPGRCAFLCNMLLDRLVQRQPAWAQVSNIILKGHRAVFVNVRMMEGARKIDLSDRLGPQKEN